MATTNSSSSGNEGVSYLQVYKGWLDADHSRNGDFTIPIDFILLKLIFRDVLLKPEYQILDHVTTDQGKILKLFVDVLPAKGEHGLNHLMDILLENKYCDLANDLASEIEKALTAVITSTTHSKADRASSPIREASPSRNDLIKAQTYLRRLIKENVDYMAKYWSDVIRVAQTNDAFVDVQVLENFRDESGLHIFKFREIFEKDENSMHKRVLIKGDPGCGKTTYVNKLALDWATNKDEYLNDNFDFVFLIALQSMTMQVEHAINCFVPDELNSFFWSLAKSGETKVLLILDGFDEFAESSTFYKPVMDILNVRAVQFQFFHVIVTSRRSHIDKIPLQFRARSLLVKGFDERSMISFLGKQQVPLPSIVEKSNLPVLLLNPLFCVIYCSLHFGGDDAVQLEDAYDFIKALIENCVYNSKRLKGVTNEVEQLDELGKFASEYLRMSGFLSFSKYKSQSYDLRNISLDLLIRKKVPTVGIDRFKDEFSFPHRLVAEYLSARYHVRTLSETDLKEADITQFFLGIRGVFYDPYLQFHLFELCSFYMEKKIDDIAFDNILKNSLIRILWNCKSTNNRPSVADITELQLMYANQMLINNSRLFPTLRKCTNLTSLNLCYSGLATSQVKKMAQIIEEGGFEKIVELNVDGNGNVGSSSAIFAAFANCKYLTNLSLHGCQLTVESVEILAKCIEGDGLQNLKELNLGDNKNVGMNKCLLCVLHKCQKIEKLTLDGQELTNYLLDIFVSTIKPNTFQYLVEITFYANKNISLVDGFFIAFSNCPKITRISVGIVKCKLSQRGEQAKTSLIEQGCQLDIF